MNTQNVKTATSESTETGDNTPLTPTVMMMASPAALTGWMAVVRNGEWRSTQRSLSLEDCRRFYPDTELMTLEAYFELIAAPHRTAVREITEARFTDQLEVMPPRDWFSPGNGQGQSFKSAELWKGDVTSIFANVRGRFFEFRDRKHLNHADIVARITEEVFNREQA